MENPKFRRTTAQQARPEPTMARLQMNRLYKGKLRANAISAPVSGALAADGIVGFPRCQPPAEPEAEVFSASSRCHGQAFYVSAMEKTADEISQDPQRYDALRQLASSSRSETARSFLGLADECREQRWIELERTSVGEPRRPLKTLKKRAKPVRPKSRAAQAEHALRRVQRALAQEDDEAPLIPTQGRDEGSSD